MPARRWPSLESGDIFHKAVIVFQCQYAVIRFHRQGVLAPDYAILSTQEALLARN